MASNNNRSAIRQAYNDYLGRDAEESEVENWVSGGYGGGGIDDWLNQIKNSDEGQRYRLEEAYWEYLGRGAEDSEIDKWMSGGYGSGGIDDWLNQIQDSEEAKDYTAGAQTPQPDPTPPAVPITRGGTNTSPPTGETGSAPDESDQDTPQSGSPSVDPSTTKPEDIDLDYENAREQLRAAYRTHIGREASDDEIQRWWSGEYGWGQKGFGGLEGWLRGIKHEGARLKGLNTGTNNEGTGVPARTGEPPPGYDRDKWNDPAHHTTKYDAAAFLYGLTKPSEIAAMVQSARFQARFPGATFVGKDKIDFGNNLEDGVPVGVIDVLMGADQGANTSSGLYWGSEGGDDPEPGQDGAGQDGAGQDGAGTDGSAFLPGTAGSAFLPGTAGPGQTGPGTKPLDNPLSNPALTPGPPSLGYGMGPGGGGGTMGNMIAPYNPLATYSPTPYTPPAPFRPPSYQGATPFAQDPYAAADPFAQDPYSAATPFTAPTAEDMAADPSYQFRLRQGQEALERSGAARGVTNTGGTLKDILDYGQQAASQEYGNVYGRQRDMYDMNERNRFNSYQANYGNAMDAYGMNERNRFNAYQSNYGNAMDAYNMNERNRAGAFDRNVGNARDAYAMNEENRYRGYTTNEIARLQQNQEAENRRSGAYNTNLGAYERQQQYGLRAQGQGFDQAFRNWAQQYNQRDRNQTTAFNQRYLLGTT